MRTLIPTAPALFGGTTGRAHARFINAWADGVVLGGIARLIVRDLLDVVAPQDAAYFRESREARFGMTLEQVQAGRETRVVEFRAGLLPARLALGRQPWLGGEAPSYADYILFGTLQWPRCVSRFDLLEADDPIAGWRSACWICSTGSGGARRAPDEVRAAQAPIRCSTSSRRMRCSTVFEQVDPLPGAKYRSAPVHRNAELRLGQRRLDVRRHVVRPFVLMPIAGILRHQPAKECLEVGADVGIGVLLHQQRGRRVPAPDRQQAGADRLRRDPATHLVR